MSDEKDQLLKDGFSDYVTKPIDEAMLRHSLYEYCDFQLFNDSGKNTELQNTANVKVSAKNEPNHNAIFNWSLALQRAANNKSLAREMFAGLINSLPETKLALEDAITSQDIELAKQLIHKLNGACCYTGVPNLAEITQQIETELKKGVSLDDLAPEWMEFFEHADAVLRHAEKLFPIIDQTD